MSADTAGKSGQLHTAVATWIFLLADAGHAPDDAGLATALDAFRDADDASDADALGKALVDAVRTGLGDSADLGDLVAYLGRLYGAGRLTTDLGQDRESRAQAARRAQFATNLPWLARIIDRFPDGSVGSHWLLVERVDEQVTCMDPYPWDELDEEYTQPLLDFMVKWELAGCEGVRWVG